jgi:translation initiation factor 5A
MSKPAELGGLKSGQYIIIDEEPCRIVDFEKSKPGKHGAAKARITAIGVFTGQKRSIVGPVTSKVTVPIIEKRTGQVISLMGDNVQLMDLETYETFEAPVPEEENIKDSLESGVEVEYWRILGNVKIVRRK